MSQVKLAIGQRQGVTIRRTSFTLASIGQTGISFPEKSFRVRISTHIVCPQSRIVFNGSSHPNGSFPFSDVVLESDVGRQYIMIHVRLPEFHELHEKNNEKQGFHCMHDANGIVPQHSGLHARRG